MANTVLGKVSCVPRGDYNASTTYYALDIVGYKGGSYLARKEVTGVTPSNDQVNWMQLSGPGLPGVDGVTFTPSVNESGEISWTNDGDKENPDPVNIMGPTGAAAGFGTVTATADNTSSETPSVDVQSSGPDTAKNFTFAFTGLKGNPGETPDIEIGTVNTLEPGQDATADITGTTPNLTLSLGIPKGQPGTSVSRIQRTSGTGAAGTTDTYTMYDSNDDAIGTFTVYNGANGAGAGDMMADGSVPMTGALNMGGNKITNLGAPGADTDAVRKSDLDAVAAEVDGILDGTTPAHLAPATDTKIGGVIIGDGLSVEADGTLSADDQLPAGGTQGQVLTQGTTGPEWQDAPSGLPDGGAPGQVLTQGQSGPEWTDAPGPLPTGGETGQVLTKTAEGTAWDDVPSDLPAGGTDGQILTKTVDGVAWEDAPEGGVTSFNSRTGAITPQAGDYTADMVGAIPTQTGTQGQVLGFTADNTVGAMDAPSGLPSGGTPGQMLYQGESGPEWGDKPVMYVHITRDDDSGYQADKTAQEIYEAVQNNIFVSALSQTAETSMEIPLYTASSSGGNYYIAFAGMVGGSTKYASITNTGNGEHVDVFVTALPANSVAFTPGSTGLTSDNVQDAIEEVQGNIPTDYVPDTRTINGQALSQNITLDAEDVGAMPPPTRLTATLSSSGWSGNRQAITVNGVITNTSAQDIDISCADKASADAWTAGGVWCSNPTQANKLTFTCTTPPTATINLNIRLWEVG